MNCEVMRVMYTNRIICSSGMIAKQKKIHVAMRCYPGQRWEQGIKKIM